MCVPVISEATIKETLCEGKKEIMKVNISYPAFSGGDEKTAARLNEFYSAAAHEFYTFCKNRYFPRIPPDCEDKKGVVMRSFVPFAKEGAMSVITEVSFFDGKCSKIKRLVHNWSIPGAIPIKAKKAFVTSSAAKKKYIGTIAEKIIKNDAGFDYFPNADLIASRKFDFEKFYFTPKGVAFYYDGGVLFGSESRPAAFVIPFCELEGGFCVVS